ncbi:MAG TPA: hypothetical protein VI278_08215 [Nitrososphaeraceae archaeon]
MTSWHWHIIISHLLSLGGGGLACVFRTAQPRSSSLAADQTASSNAILFYFTFCRHSILYILMMYVHLERLRFLFEISIVYVPMISSANNGTQSTKYHIVVLVD